MDLVEIRGKRGRKVPVLLTEQMKQAIELLIKKRPKDIPECNKFIFARPSRGSVNHLRGCDSLSENVSELPQLKQPQTITSTRLRKYIATMSQVAALSENDMDWLARHLGHDIKTHRQFYRLHESIVELAKISKLLVAVDHGNIEHLKGKTLGEIQIEGMYFKHESERKRITANFKFQKLIHLINELHCISPISLDFSVRMHEFCIYVCCYLLSQRLRACPYSRVIFH